MYGSILVLDFGSQYTQLIARRIRELQVYSLIKPYNISISEIKKINPKGIILSGGPASVYEKQAPFCDRKVFQLGIPILGICYGLQTIVHILEGKVKKSVRQEYGRALMYIDDHHDLFFTLPAAINVWMSHADYTVKLPPGFVSMAHTRNAEYAAVASRDKKIWGVQFHPEVIHTEFGTQIISNFLFRICGCFANWELSSFVDEAISKIRKQVRDKKVIGGLSGGVDSSTLALLLQKAIGRRFKGIFVNNGLLRKGEASYVVKVFRRSFKIDLKYIDARREFLRELRDITDPEEKRKIIGHKFIEVFEKEAKKVKGVEFLAQGTLYPDVIESISFSGAPSVRIKSHHNVGGLPLNMKLKLVEPFRELFKDEVRKVAKILGLPDALVYRHPFPGPGLGVRIVGEITPRRLRILREADAIIEKVIKKEGIYRKIWQAFAVLLPLKSVGVMGDRRTYEYVIALRAVESQDGMTADWVKLSPQVLAEISARIINEVEGVNRVVYDISSKPPSTIEWE
ncbi:MAG: glutamine-hydrolyzing GMP synthase [Candidatus Omnitrophica bacterium]|nr:glutamine-hydrolyzing GMP synthase [Candidatus Omnitrophota bacterium]